MRIGQGFDVHAFGPGDTVVIGGVGIAHSHGLVAHSDGDVLLHAICDALLGAAGLPDIGQLFPDNDPALAGVDSRILLRQVSERLGQSGHQVGNIDATIIAQAPRMAPHIAMMQALIAEDLKLATSQIGIKATTTERLGFCGRGEGIAALAVALIKANPA